MAAASSSSGPIGTVVSAIQSSTSLKFASVSVLSILVAATVLNGVWAGIVGVVGATFFLVSISLYSYIWYAKQSGTEEVDPLE